MGKQAKSKNEEAARGLGSQLAGACVEGDAELVKKLIGKGAPIEFSGKSLVAPLHAAVKARRLDCVKALVKVLAKAGADFESKDEWGSTVQMSAAIEFANYGGCAKSAAWLLAMQEAHVLDGAVAASNKAKSAQGARL